MLDACWMPDAWLMLMTCLIGIAAGSMLMAWDNLHFYDVPLGRREIFVFLDLAVQVPTWAGGKNINSDTLVTPWVPGPTWAGKGTRSIAKLC